MIGELTAIPRLLAGFTSKEKGKEGVEGGEGSHLLFLRIYVHAY